MLEAIRHGYVSDGGFISPDKRFFFLGIPKNASTYLSNIFLAHEWQHHIIGSDSQRIERVLIVLKDPMDRWVSGIGTYISSWILGPNYGSHHFLEDYTEAVERLLFESLILDDHTTPQVRFIKDFQSRCSVPITYFKLGPKLLSHLSEVVGQELKEINVSNNASEDHFDQRRIIQFIKDRIAQDFVLRTRVIKRFQEDYDFINNLDFYYESR
jgi:hypothetical protein